MKLLSKLIISFACLIMSLGSANAQRVYPLVSGLTIDSLLLVKPNATKIAMDPVTNHLFYTTVNGDIFEVFNPSPGVAFDSLRYTSANHGITFLQGLFFRDSIMYVCGNVWSSTTTVASVWKATLQPSGSRTWTNIMTTVPYPSSSAFGDHGFAGVSIDPSGNYIFVSSGARTHLGEVRTNGGAWPDKREVPLSTRIFRFPINTTGLVLPNDSTLIDNSGYVYAWGTRNAYDLAWDGNDTLFAIDNSGERDDPEELNWLRQGKHYGYPWRMGSNDNPLRFSPYDVNTDPLVNHLSGGYTNGWFNDDPTFPAVPGGVTFTDPVRNYGTAADFYRDPTTGSVKNASDEGTYITSFTSHRSPLGLSFDRDSLLGGSFRGNGFVLNFMPGGDSTGYTPLSPWGSPCPFVDPTRDLIQMNLTFNSGIDNYTMTTSRIAEGFYLAVDATLEENTMYVIENGGSIWRVNFPAYVGVDEMQNQLNVSVYPNPANDKIQFQFVSKESGRMKIVIMDVQGKKVMPSLEKEIQPGEQQVTVNVDGLAPGIYLYQVQLNDVSTVGKIIKFEKH